MTRSRFPLFPRPTLAAAAGLLLVSALALAKDHGSDPANKVVGRSPELERRREGTRYEGLGRFEITGDRVAFCPAEGQESFRILENLALERVSRVLGESREPRQWNVTGILTEFQGGNYLLLTRATVKLPTVKESSRP